MGSWDVAKPGNPDIPADYPAIARADKAQLQADFSVEHDPLGSDTGHHRFPIVGSDLSGSALKEGRLYILGNILKWVSGGKARSFRDHYQLLDRQTAQVVVANTTLEANLYNFSIPAGVFGSSDVLRLKIIADAINNFGSGPETLVIRSKLGATDLTSVVGVTFSLLNNANRIAIVIGIEILGVGSTNSQVAATRISLSQNDGTAGAPPTGGGTSLDSLLVNNAVAEDMTVAKNLRVTARFVTANASLSIRALSSYLELIRA